MFRALDMGRSIEQDGASCNNVSSPAPSAGEEGPRCASNGEMRGKWHTPMPALPHLPQLRWGPLLSRGAGEDEVFYCTGVHSTWSMRVAPVASITSLSNPSATPDAGGIIASASSSSSSMG